MRDKSGTIQIASAGMRGYQGRSLQERKPRQAATANDEKHRIELGPRFALAALGPRPRHPRDDRLRLVDEPHPGPGGPVLLSLDPRQYRLRHPGSDAAQADLARHQPVAGDAVGYASLATHAGVDQSLDALCRHIAGGDAGLG